MLRINTKKLEQLMAEQCIDNKTLASLSKISVVTIRKIKNGENVKTRESTIGKIAHALNVSIEEITED